MKTISNPLIKYPHHTSVRYPLYIGTLLFGLLLLSDAWLLMNGYFDLVRALFIVGWMLIIGMPLYTAVFSVRYILLASKANELELVWLSTLPTRQFIIGYGVRVLRLLRWLIIPLMMSLPLLLVGMVHNLIFIEAEAAAKLTYSSVTAPTSSNIMPPAVGFAFVMANTWVFIVFAALLGVSMGIWWHDATKASLTAMGVLLGFMTLAFISIIWVYIIPQSADVILGVCSPIGFLIIVYGAFEQLWRFTQEAIRLPRE